MLGSDGTCKRSQIACRRETNEWNVCLQAVDSSFEKAKSRIHMLREKPKADAHWALWVDCELLKRSSAYIAHPRETTHRSDCRHCVANWVLNKHSAEKQMGKFLETCGHLGDYSEQHLHARHRLTSLNWQLRRWTRQSAAARRTSVGSDLHRA